MCVCVCVCVCVCIFWSCPMACGNLVPRAGDEPGPSAVKAQSPDHWTTREFPIRKLFEKRANQRQCTRSVSNTD